MSECCGRDKTRHGPSEWQMRFRAIPSMKYIGPKCADGITAPSLPTGTAIYEHPLQLPVRPIALRRGVNASACAASAFKPKSAIWCDVILSSHWHLPFLRHHAGSRLRNLRRSGWQCPGRSVSQVTLRRLTRLGDKCQADRTVQQICFIPNL